MRLIAPVLAAALITAAAAVTQAAPPAPAATAGAFAALPAGHAEDGATVFKKCSACHKVGAGAMNGVGPVLNGIVGRAAGTFAGYSYSDSNKKSGLTWTPDTLAAYLPDPMKLIPGTKMTFAGLKTPQEVADVIAYLKTFDATGKQTP